MSVGTISILVSLKLDVDFAVTVAIQHDALFYPVCPFL